MTEHKGLPVAGYKPQSDEKVGIVNGFKQDEERILRKLDNLYENAGVGRMADLRWLAIGRTQLEQAFMAINRAVFQPGRVELPEDADDTLFPPAPAHELRAENVGRPVYFSARSMTWHYSDTDEDVKDASIIAREEARINK